LKCPGFGVRQQAAALQRASLLAEPRLVDCTQRGGTRASSRGESGSKPPHSKGPACWPSRGLSIVPNEAAREQARGGKAAASRRTPKGQLAGRAAACRLYPARRHASKLAGEKRRQAAALQRAGLLAGIAPQAEMTASKLAGDKAAASRRTPKSIPPSEQARGGKAAASRRTPKLP
jgi:hypothetical protein